MIASQDARCTPAEFIAFDGAAPGHVAHIAWLRVGDQNRASRRADSVGAHHQVRGQSLTVGQGQRDFIAPILKVRKLSRQVVALGAEGVEQPLIQLEVRRQPVCAGLLVGDRAVSSEITKPAGGHADVADRLTDPLHEIANRGGVCDDTRSTPP